MVAVAVLGLAGTGAIAQSVTFGGSAGMGVKYEGATKVTEGTGDAAEEYTKMESVIKWVSDFDVAMSASGTTDGGLTFGAAATIKASNGDSAVGNSNVYIGGESWKIAIGDLDPASDKGKSLGDVGYDGLDVDNVAEIGGSKADVEVSFSLGTASMAITAGQKPGSARVAAVDSVPNKYRHHVTFTALEQDWTMSFDNPTKYNDIDALTGDRTVSLDGKTYYIASEKLYEIDGCRDSTAGQTGTDCDPKSEDEPADKADKEVTEGTVTNLIIADTTFVPGSDEVAAKAATKEKTEWAAGVSFAIGSTTLGIGMDSEDLMQASVSADLGAFSGKLFYAQQDVGEKSKGTEAKVKGTGIEIGVSAGANTTINAVYSQAKTDYTSADMKDKTDKGFGVGVSHGLGGGATLEAGFAKVKKQTKASVGVTMSF